MAVEPQVAVGGAMEGEPAILVVGRVLGHGRGRRQGGDNGEDDHARPGHCCLLRVRTPPADDGLNMPTRDVTTSRCGKEPVEWRSAGAHPVPYEWPIRLVF